MRDRLAALLLAAALVCGLPAACGQEAGNAESVTVALYDLGPGLCEYDEEQGSFSGAAVDLLDAVAVRAGLAFRYVLLAPDCPVTDAFDAAGARIAAPIMESEVTPQPRGFALSDEVMESRLSCVARGGRVVSANESIVISRAESLFAIDEQVMQLFPNATMLPCADGEAALRAVDDGRADLCLDNELVVLMRLRNPYYEGLASYPAYRWAERMRLAVRETEDPQWLARLNRAIAGISEVERAEAVLRSTAGRAYALTVGESLYRHRVALLLALGLFLMAALGAHFYRRAMGRQRQRLTEAERERARAEDERRKLETRAVADQRRVNALSRKAMFSERAGIYNRAGFAEATRHLLDADPDEPYVLVASDLKHFKGYADLFGKAEEDRLIAALSLSLNERFRGRKGAYGHLGGDCFISCSPLKEMDVDGMIAYVDRVLENSSRDYDYTVLFGLYAVEDRSLSVNMMIDRALLALRHVHGEQMARCMYYTSEMGERVRLEQRMITDMPTALRKRQFKVFYQPQYSLTSGVISGAEALVRWEHPTYGLLSPMQFIPLLEENGLISRLTEYVVDETLAQIRRWREELGREMSVSVNISRIDTFESGFVERLARKADEAGVPRRLLHLEVTETAFIQNESHMVRVAAALREAGFPVEMDDFGSGYSSLNTLKDLWVDTLKLDMRFLSDSGSERGNVILVSVVEMARRMNLPLIAEGVENREQADFLRDIGCDTMQGYYGRRPMPAGEMTDYLKSGARLEGYGLAS